MSDHQACRDTEQRLREANRRLQAEGPALERDKTIVQLRAMLADTEAALDTQTKMLTALHFFADNMPVCGPGFGSASGSITRDIIRAALLRILEGKEAA
jgi:hypothetical protein